MALSLKDPVLAKRRAFNSPALDAATYQILIAFFSWLNQQGGKPDLQIVEFDHLTGTDTVLSADPCKVMAILLAKTTTTAAFFKASDHATTSSSTAPEIELKQAAVQVDALLFPKGMAMANGLTVSSDTTSDGNTTSAAGDGAKGIVILAAA